MKKELGFDRCNSSSWNNYFLSLWLLRTLRMSSRRNYLKMYTVIPAFQWYHISPSWWRLAFSPTFECSCRNNYIHIWLIFLCFCDRLWPFLFYMMLPHTGATVWVIICSVWIQKLCLCDLFCHPLTEYAEPHPHCVVLNVLLIYFKCLFVYLVSSASSPAV